MSLSGKLLASVAVLVALLAATAPPALAGGTTTADPDVAGPATGAPPPATASVASVYDGDTMTLSTGDRVRLRWVNTPELKPAEEYGVEARDLTSGLVLQKQVTLMYGKTTRDGYGRLLAGVKVGETNLSIALLEAGLGHLFVIPPDDTDLTPFIAAQEKARAARRGIWASARFAGVLHITSFHANADGDDRENVNGEYLRVCNVSPEALDLTGFRIADISGHSWTFPTVIVPAGNTFKVLSGKGDNQTDPAKQLEIHLGSADPIWNNTEDRATLYDRFGRVVDSRDHHADSPNP
jgi:endonuclease YncB( thermonuclease family)